MSNAQCSAINTALKNQGLTDAQLATRVGMSEQHVKDILAGTSKPTTQEFNAIAGALKLSNAAPGHAAKIIAA